MYPFSNYITADSPLMLQKNSFNAVYKPPIQENCIFLSIQDFLPASMLNSKDQVSLNRRVIKIPNPYLFKAPTTSAGIGENTNVYLDQGVVVDKSEERLNQLGF